MSKKSAVHSSTIPAPISIVKMGQRFVFKGTYGSADALLIARYFETYRDTVPSLAVVCSEATDTLRLQEELSWYAPAARVRRLPDWETLPYDTFSPHQDLVSERLATLHDLREKLCDIVLISVTTAICRVVPSSFMAAYTFFFYQGERLNQENLKSKLTLAGYEHVTQVMRPGEYCVRGGLIDIFPMGSSRPYRIDLFDDTIESIRVFDPDTQCSVYPVKEVRLLPGREFPFDEASRTAFRRRWREVFEGDPTRSLIYKDIGSAIPSGGIEYYLPLFFDETATLFHYLPKDAHLVFIGDLDSSIQRFWNDTQQRFKFLSHDHERPVLPPEKLFLLHQEFFTLAKSFARLTLTAPGDSSWATALPKLGINHRNEDPLSALRGYLSETTERVLLCVDSAGRRETILQLLRKYALGPSIVNSLADFLESDACFSITIAPVAIGFSVPSENLAILTETELYEGIARRTGRKRQQQATSVESVFRDLAELKIGDPVVHSQHGIGRYLGLISMDLGEGETEFLHLEYSSNSKLYVPVSQLHLISRYSGADPESAPLHMLGSGQWEKAKRRAAQQICDTAAELLNLHARRAARSGYAFNLQPKEYEKFANSFGFEETPDQTAAIAAVISDMSSQKSMDRLVCGDVGFGKTEVALRAAFIAVLDGKQVAILAPTTLLAEQHAQTFSNRFADWPIRIAELSRFKRTKEINVSIKAINEGKIDIVIGTHKLLSNDIQFQRLGLVIIDEEHRFGVRQKEAFKAFRAEVDILTLTATPIPRTLSMALEGLRDFSVIATAPQKRLAIKTFLRREENSVIREAMLRELKRGGQVYYLHNEVETIENQRTHLQTLMPEARIVVAHGQMHESDLEHVMRDFVTQRANVLLCTTIIETGIDVPTANTILMHRADKFGLAQLHQLRGRVGRSHHQAYAYLLVQDPQALPTQARRRLEAIQQMEDLGAGFYLAMHDLEIRGAGQVLGSKQSGEIHEIGFQLYTDMLENAVSALKDGREPDLMAPLQVTTEINLHLPAILPSNYCVNVQERLSLYKKLANCTEDAAIDKIQEELIDRFGKLPEQGKALIETHRLRLMAKPLCIAKIDAGEEVITLQFESNHTIDGLRIIEMLQKNQHIKLAGQDKLHIQTTEIKLDARVQLIKETLRNLAQPMMYDA
ncbi:transcription-repair coupling factor [Candidatus Pandoraea novymonadis]|uniref:Transcription-repair-coupling factor n=1 Tax=Candidatus Pandoraea novymonadis TaxID=1808959 RepID=A0ABX5FEU4_9BURK|nr:transcription-repair coupling factor [Candidatus Pandoraea novymonadis]PSB92174.1 Transcription-repair-coupling factor [Candidatus Pandoraea novymonadis]